MEKLTELINALVRTIARSTKSPLIEWDKNCFLFSIQVEPNDQGRLIGKSGVTIGALNVIMWYAGIQHIGRATGIRLLEPNGQKHEAVSVPFMPKDELDIPALKNLVTTVLDSTIGNGNYTVNFSANIREPITAHVAIKKSLSKKFLDPDLVTALKNIIKTAGRACGGVVDSAIFFNK